MTAKRIFHVIGMVPRAILSVLKCLYYTLKFNTRGNTFKCKGWLLGNSKVRINGVNNRILITGGGKTL